jgi:thioredoxin reductase (NADPH)
MKEESVKVFEKEEKDEDVLHYDVCILGGGPAGLTAAIYTSRYGLKTAIITKNVGGMCNLAHKIENYPGYEGGGFELMQKFYKQAKEFGSETANTEVANIKKDKTGFVVGLRSGGVVHAKTVIIALGTEKRKLRIPGEEEFIGKGVTYCATCDANFFKDKDVAVIGGRNSATKAVTILSKIAKKIYLVYRGEKLLADKNEIKKVDKLENVEILSKSLPKKIAGGKSVEKLEIEKDGKKKVLAVSGVFVEIGAIPVTEITKILGIKTDDKSYIKVNDGMETNIGGVFAAGDTVKSTLKQVVVSAGQGAIAARSAFDYLSGK